MHSKPDEWTPIARIKQNQFLSQKKGYLQAEIGFNKEKYGNGFTWVHPTALWKLGLNSRFEFRLITEGNTLDNGITKVSGLVPTQIGGKIALWKEKGLIPQTSLIFHTGIPALDPPILKHLTFYQTFDLLYNTPSPIE